MNKAVLGIGLLASAPLIGLLVANIDRNPNAISSPLIGKKAPDVVMQPLAGGPSLPLSSLRGRPAVVNFWASWCVPCVQEHAALTSGARANPDVAFVGVVYEDTPENAAAFLGQRGDAYPSYADDEGKAAIAFGVYGVPETFFLDAEGRVVSKFVGPLDPNTLRERLTAARRSGANAQ